jgi:hypothetical protein
MLSDRDFAREHALRYLESTHALYADGYADWYMDRYWPADDPDIGIDSLPSHGDYLDSIGYYSAI